MSQGRHHTSIEHLEMAARSGCMICLAVQHDLLPKIRKLDQTKSSQDWKFKYQLCLGMLYVEAANGADHDRRDTVKSFCIEPCPGIKHPKNPKDLQDLAAMDLLHQPWRSRHDDHWRHIPDNTGHSDVAKLAHDWLQTCLKTHYACKCDLQAPAYYPKRLLDLTPHKSRLILTASERPCSQYATLSHCWGPTPFFCLSSSNEDDLRRRLPVRRLPRSFRDAILFTQRLGIRYLWIDSLCILQEGPGHAEDWNEQAPLMHSVYSNGVVNISILHAQNPHIGAFKARNPDKIQPCYVSWNYNGDGEKMWAILDYKNGYHNAITCSTLSKRGWVVQERMLSPRTIHFASDRIFWECRSGDLLTESYTSGLRLSDSKFIQTGMDLSICKVPTPSIPQASEISDAWRRVITYYAAAKLSKPEKDKMVAIAGIARYFGTFFNDEYVAGFFRCRLPADLLWMSLGKDDSLPPEPAVRIAGTTTYRGPTWSWISTDREVGFWSCGDYPTEVTMEGVNVQPLDQRNKYGEIRHAEITLCGVLLPCKLTYDGEGYWQGWRAILEDFQEAEDEISLPRSKIRKRTDEIVSIKLDRTLLPSSEQSLMVLPFTHSDGLLLQSTRILGVYVRVGIFYHHLDITISRRRQTFQII